MAFTPIQRGQAPSAQQIIELQRALGGIGEYQNWTPTVTQGVAVSVTVTEAVYSIIGKTCHVQVQLTITSAGTSGQVIFIGGLPIAARPVIYGSEAAVGTGFVTDTGTLLYVGTVRANAATTFIFQDNNTALVVGLGFALANGDKIGFNATYRVA